VFSGGINSSLILPAAYCLALTLPPPRRVLPQVLPDAFMVTAPHKRASSWRPVPGTAADAAHLQRISGVYADFKQQLAAQGLRPGCS
jgi:hypothetical protein